MTNQKNLIIGILAGLASTLMSIGADMGTPLAMPLFIFSPLAILIAGLGWGSFCAIIATAIAGLLLLAFSSPSHAGISLLLTFIPAAWSSHMAGLCREDEGHQQWYPLSQILFRLALYFAAAFCLIGIIIQFNVAELAKLIEQIYRQLINTNQLPGSSLENAASIQDIARFYAALLPYTMPAFWLCIFAINLQIAAKITRASGMMLRPQDDIPINIGLPKIAIGIALFSFVLSFADAPLGEFSAVFAGSFLMAFTLIGLALIHAISRDKPARILILAAAYFCIFIIGFPLFIFALAGIGETLIHWREKNLSINN